MHHFLVPNLGVAVIRMRWFGRHLRADMCVRVPSAEFLLRDTGVTSLALQSVSSAAFLWLLRASLKWLKVGIQGHVFLVNSADFLHRYTSLACLTLCLDGIATILRFWKCNGPCRSCWSHNSKKKHQSRCNQSSKLHGVFVFAEVLLMLMCVFVCFHLSSTCVCVVCWSSLFFALIPLL